MNILGIGESVLLKKSALNLTWCTDKPNNSRRQKVLETSMNYKKKIKNCVLYLMFSGLIGNGKDLCRGCWGSAGVC